MFARKWPLICIALVAGLTGVSAGIATLVQYKPWGVPDVMREAYDTKIQQLSLAKAIESGQEVVTIPRVEVAKRNVTFRGILEGQEIKQTFQISNVGTGALEINVDEFQFEDQGAPDVEWQLSTTKLSPMSEASLTISWNASELEANQQRRLTVTTNDPLQPKIRFSVHAIVSRPLLVPSTIGVGNIDRYNVFKADFFVASETIEDLGVLGLSADLDSFEWQTVPVNRNSIPEDYALAKHVTKIEFQGSRSEFGAFEVPLRVDMLLDGEPVQRTITVAGKVKAPIAFIHPDMDRREGLSIGTVSSRQDTHFAVAVQHRGEKSRKLEVLDHEPGFLDVSIEPGEGGYSSCRLIIKIPKGTPTQTFDRDDHHGYISVGDPADKGFTGWFKIYGSVAREE